MIAHHDVTVVEALLVRLKRDGILHEALRICNFQYQVTLQQRRQW